MAKNCIGYTVPHVSLNKTLALPIAVWLGWLASVAIGLFSQDLIGDARADSALLGSAILGLGWLKFGLAWLGESGLAWLRSPWILACSHFHIANASATSATDTDPHRVKHLCLSLTM